MIGASSPHLRGSRPMASSTITAIGVIPAPAGQPRSQPPPWRRARSHPRTCGAAAQWHFGMKAHIGSSPHLRGSRAVPGGVRRRDRVIPAPAGQPCRRRRNRSIPEGHPRTCGAARDLTPPHMEHEGSSPHLRGSPLSGLWLLVPPGVIPAPAGQPAPTILETPNAAGHPRTCGAASGPGNRVALA